MTLPDPAAPLCRRFRARDAAWRWPWADIVRVLGLRSDNPWQFEQRVASGQVQAESLRGRMPHRPRASPRGTS